MQERGNAAGSAGGVASHEAVSRWQYRAAAQQHCLGESHRRRGRALDDIEMDAAATGAAHGPVFAAAAADAAGDDLQHHETGAALWTG